MDTRTRQPTSWRWVLPFLAAIVAVLATLLSSASASAATQGTAETRVRASTAVADVLVEPPQREPAGQRLGEEPSRVVTVVATGVAANGGRAIPFGPASDDAWAVLNRVDAKGSPLPGYKGGKVWDNNGTQGAQVLPRSGADGSAVTYKEWDLTQKVKGVDRDGRRLVTGSDGSAYYTTDHYVSFIQIR